MSKARGFDLLPAIDLRGGQVVRLREGDFDRETAFSNDPVAVAEGFVATGAGWLHVVDLDGARSGSQAHGPVIAAIAAAVGERCRIEVAGGLRDEGAVAAALQAGAARAVVGTAVLQDPDLGGRLVDTHGADRIVASIDVRDGQAVGHGWAHGAPGTDVFDAVRTLADVGVALFEVTAIDRDGLLEGPDLPLYEQLVRLGRGTVIASGGIASIDDLRAVRDVGCAGAIIGRALYEGRIELRRAIADLAGR